jgi:hypothetical protein
MKFHNPWIDPRVTQLRPASVEAYLLAHDWKLVGPAANPALLIFEGPARAEGPLTILLPRQVSDGASLQRMIDVVVDLARHEGRWAVDVLSDLLRRQPAAPPANGPAAPTPAEEVSR